MQDRCEQNKQTMMRLEQKYIKSGYEMKNSGIMGESPLNKSSLKQKSLVE